MIKFNLTKDGFSSNLQLSDELLNKSKVSNIIVTIECKPPFRGTVEELIDLAQNYIESHLTFELVSNRVIFESSTSYAEDGHPIVERIVTQYYW